MINIYYTKESYYENNIHSGWTVKQDDKYADGLDYDEMLGLVAALTMPVGRPCLQWMKTEEQHEKQRKYFKELSSQ